MTSITVKAGRASRRGETNWVDPNPAKGLIKLEPQEDLLMFSWTSREIGAAGGDSEELILFPGDCEFVKVDADPSGRSYVLKFSSSDERSFFWFQDASPQHDQINCYNINSLIQNPSFVPVALDSSEPVPDQSVASAAATAMQTDPVQPPASSSSQSAIPATPSITAPTSSIGLATPHPTRTADLSTLIDRDVQNTPAPSNVHARGLGGLGLSETPVAGSSLGSSSSSGAGAGAGGVFSQDQVDALARIFQARGAGTGAGAGAGAAVAEDARLTDILTATNLVPIFTKTPSLLTSLVPHLPSTLPISNPPTTSEISEIISSSQFREAVAGLDEALKTGGLTGLMAGLGLPSRAGAGVGEFLEEVEKQGKSGGKGDEEDKMDTD